MICRRCGAELPDNAIRCSNCGIRVKMYCPACKTLNYFGNERCTNCNFELLINCPDCGTKNVYSAEECRKCHMPLNQKKKDSFPKENSVSQEIPIVEAFSADNTASVLNEIFNGEEPCAEEKNNEDLQIPEASQLEEAPVCNPDKDLENKQLFNISAKDETDINNNAGNTDLSGSYENYSEPQVNNKPEEQEDNCLLNENNDNIPELQEVIITNPAEQETDEKTEEDFFNEQEQENEEKTEEENLNFEIQSEAVLKIINLVKTSLTKHIIAVNGAEGCGKTAVLNQVNGYLSGKGFISVYGSCTPLVQITSFGFFQDAFLRMMGFPPFVKSTEAFIKDFEKSSFSKMFGFLDKSELRLFLNIFYPSQKDIFANILENKNQMFHILEKVLKSFLVNNNVIIAIDNFELLDGASYDFIVYLLKKGFFNNRLKLLAAYQENKSIQSYFDLSNAEEKIFETILIKKFQKEDLIKAVSRSISININEIIDADYLEELTAKSDGNAIRMEQEAAFLFDIGYISVDNNKIEIKEENKPEVSPASFEELIKLRINSLTPPARNVLFMAAVMGYRFSTAVLSLSVAMPANKAESIINYLIQELFIQQVDKYTCEFKSLTLWKLIYQEAKSDLLYKENSQRLYSALKPLILSSNLQKLISCSEALSNNEAFLIWQNTASLTAKLGDTNLYIIAQKQCLKILDKQDIADSEEIKKQIYEEIGKLLWKKSPKEAITYLSNVLDSDIKDSNVRRILDVSAYFIKSCYLTGNYFGAAEAVDAVIKSFEYTDVSVSELDIALIKTRKLKALLNIGNSEQIINMANEEIIPVLEKELNSKKLETSYKTIIIYSLLNTKLVLAKAYAQQGNNLVLKVIEDIRLYIEKNNLISDKTYYLTAVNIIEAFSKTVLGDINKSNEILNAAAASYKNKNMENDILAEWNLINIINRVLLGQNNDLKVDLFELAAFTNNINEHFIKNIIKLILGYVLKKEGNTIKAVEIFNEEITYFAKEKVAIGALLSWALIVKLSIDMGDIEKALNTAVKSLEIAQSPKINNYLFIIYFQKFLAEIYLRKGDLTAAKMYLEKSVMIAKQFDLKYQLIELYIAYGEYMEEFMKVNNSYSSEYIKLTGDMYNKALLLSKELKLANMKEIALRVRSEFKTFCQLNSIEI